MEAAAWAVPERNEVLILEDHAEGASLESLVHTLVEEFVHLSSGGRDGSITFEKALISKIVELITPRRPEPAGLVF
jgi:hypothetical protein